MALEHKTVVTGINISRGGSGNIGLKLFIGDGGNEFGETIYRFVIEKDEAIVPKLQEVNADLVSQGREPIPTKASIVIRDTLQACWAAMDA